MFPLGPEETILESQDLVPSFCIFVLVCFHQLETHFPTLKLCVQSISLELLSVAHKCVKETLL